MVGKRAHSCLLSTHAQSVRECDAAFAWRPPSPLLPRPRKAPLHSSQHLHSSRATLSRHPRPPTRPHSRCGASQHHLPCAPCQLPARLSTRLRARWQRARQRASSLRRVSRPRLVMHSSRQALCPILAPATLVCASLRQPCRPSPHCALVR